jgi:CBS domain-containing protein
VVVEDMLEVRVGRLGDSIPAVSPNDRVSELVGQFVMGTDDRAFPVVQDERLVGLVCLEDIRKVPRTDWDGISIANIMTPAEQLEFVTHQEDASDALQKLARRDVSDAGGPGCGKLVGMLRRRDILRWLQLQSEMAAGKI